MAVNGRVQILDEVEQAWPNGWRLCFQRVRYIYDDGSLQEGYRFIYRRPDGSLQGARGQAKIPSLRIARLLMAEAEKAGWGHYDADNDDCQFAEPSEAAA